MIKSKVRGDGSLHLTALQSRYLEAGPEAEPWRKASCSNCFLIQSMNTCLKKSCPQSAGPSHINHWSKNVPQTCLQISLMEAILQFRFPALKRFFSCQIHKRKERKKKGKKKTN